MSKTILSMLCVSAVLLVASVAQAGSVAPWFFNVYGDEGNTLLPANSLIVYVADVDGDGFGYDSAALERDSFLVDEDDAVLGIGVSSEDQAGLIGGTTVWPDSESYEGKPFGILWFDTAYEDGLTGAGEGVNYGFWQTDETVPSGVFNAEDFGTTSDYRWSTTEGGAGGTLPNDTFYADMVTIPEPFTMGVLAIGGLAMLRRRRVA